MFRKNDLLYKEDCKILQLSILMFFTNNEKKKKKDDCFKNS